MEAGAVAVVRKPMEPKTFFRVIQYFWRTDLTRDGVAGSFETRGARATSGRSFVFTRRGPRGTPNLGSRIVEDIKLPDESAD
jgi:hypothetical protein